MRAALATEGSLLTVSWAGRPKWFFHGMALGEPIGKSLLRAQNSRYYQGYGAGGVHVALMGDPTLTMRYLPSNGSITVASEPGKILVGWEDLPIDADGVVVYSRVGKVWIPLHEGVWVDDSWEMDAEQGQYEMAIRPARLETTPSGSYWNVGRLKPAQVFVEERKEDDGPGQSEPPTEEASKSCASMAGSHLELWGWMGLLAVIVRWRSKRYGESA